VASGAVRQDYRWQSELSAYAEALAGIKPSCQYFALGQPFLVPTRDDYAEAFARAGVLAAGDELAGSPELVAASQAHWHSVGSNGCVFAAHMSALRDESGWETYVLADRGSPRADAQALAHLVHPRLTAPEAEVVSVVIPHGDEAAYVAALVGRLGEMPGWAVSVEGSEIDSEHGKLVRLGLRNDVEFGFVAEVLGFGAHGAYANTRRAPFTELAVRAKAPRKRPQDKRAFMAHVDIPGLEKYEFSLWWRQTEANRRARIEPSQDERGKARVTVVLPKTIWEEGA
jgi:hypothetical protein